MTRGITYGEAQYLNRRERRKLAAQNKKRKIAGAMQPFVKPRRIVDVRRPEL